MQPPLSAPPECTYLNTPSTFKPLCTIPSQIFKTLALVPGSTRYTYTVLPRLPTATVTSHVQPTYFEVN